MNEQLELRYVPLSTVVRWEHNPKLHDLDRISESVKRYGFGDPPKYDATLQALVYGNGRIEVLEKLREAGEAEPPPGVLAGEGDHADDWLVPVIFGVDQASVEMAEQFALDHNSLTLGPKFSASHARRLWDPEAVSRIAKGWSTEARDLVVPLVPRQTPPIPPGRLSTPAGAEDRVEDLRVLAGYRSAMARTEPSSPMAWYESEGLLVPDVLDYGAGRDPHEHARFDPVHGPDYGLLTPGRWRTITCNYVLQVIALPHARWELLMTLRSLLVSDGALIVAVCRQVEEDVVGRSFQAGLTAEEWESVFRLAHCRPERLDARGFWAWRLVPSVVTVASPLRTSKGSVVERHVPVGKRMGKRVYVHRRYADLVVPRETWEAAIEAAQAAEFQFNCVRYDLGSGAVRLDEAPDFDSAREPSVGRTFEVTSGRRGQSRSIWHHKWMWVLDDYDGFDVAESHRWSARWLAALTEPAKGTRATWKKQLRAAGLDVDA